ncbi:MAG: hypothetical protein AAF915_30635 [Cyanobacteria bacterium P01_D01_bin.50]
MGRKAKIKAQRRLARQINEPQSFINHLGNKLGSLDKVIDAVSVLSHEQEQYFIQRAMDVFSKNNLKGMLCSVYEHPVLGRRMIESNEIPNDIISSSEYDPIFDACAIQTLKYYAVIEEKMGDEKHLLDYMNFVTICYPNLNMSGINVNATCYGEETYNSLRGKENWMVKVINRLQTENVTFDQIMREYEKGLGITYEDDEPDNNDSYEGDNHKFPHEHQRKTHKRRVRYGEGRAFIKWVEINETTVKKGVKKI